MDTPVYSRRMKILRLLLGMTLVLPLLAADPAADWLRLGRLSPAKKVEIRFRNGQIRIGTVQKVDADSLTFVEGRGATPVKREEVWMVRTRSRLRGALWGTAIGFGTGAVVGAAVSHVIAGRPTASDYAQGIGGVGGTLGGIGAVIGTAVGKEHTLYRAR